MVYVTNAHDFMHIVHVCFTCILEDPFDKFPFLVVSEIDSCGSLTTSLYISEIMVTYLRWIRDDIIFIIICILVHGLMGCEFCTK